MFVDEESDHRGVEGQLSASKQLHTDQDHPALRDQEFPPLRHDRRKHPVREDRLLEDVTGVHDTPQQRGRRLSGSQGQFWFFS